MARRYPMWGYSCGAVGSAVRDQLRHLETVRGRRQLVALSDHRARGQDLTINLTNNLSIPVRSLTPTATIPTSLVIVGQFGGGLGTPRGATASPDPTRAAQTVDLAHRRTLRLRRIAPDTGFASAILLRGGAGGTARRRLTWEAQTSPGHLSARIGHSSIDSGADGSVRNSSGDHGAYRRYTPTRRGDQRFPP